MSIKKVCVQFLCVKCLSCICLPFFSLHDVTMSDALCVYPRLCPQVLVQCSAFCSSLWLAQPVTTATAAMADGGLLSGCCRWESFWRSSSFPTLTYWLHVLPGVVAPSRSDTRMSFVVVVVVVWWFSPAKQEMHVPLRVILFTAVVALCRWASLSLGLDSLTFVDKCASHRWRLFCQTCTGTRRSAAKPLPCSPSWSAWGAAWVICYPLWTGAVACSLFTWEARPSASSPFSSSSSSPVCSSPWRCLRNPAPAAAWQAPDHSWSRGLARSKTAGAACRAHVATCWSANWGCSSPGRCCACWERAGPWPRPSTGATVMSRGWWGSCAWPSSAAGWPSCLLCSSTRTLWGRACTRACPAHYQEVYPGKDTMKVSQHFAHTQAVVSTLYKAWWCPRRQSLVIWLFVIMASPPPPVHRIWLHPCQAGGPIAVGQEAPVLLRRSF